MIAVPAPAKTEVPLWPLSVEAYHALGQLGLIPESTELLYGFVYHKMPKSPAHGLLFMRLLRLLQDACPPGFHVRPEQPITCVDSEPEPDLSVVLGSPEDYAKNHPFTAELAVEICVTSHEYDHSKLRAYATAGVKEVWLVLGPEKRVEICRLPQLDRFDDHVVLAGGATLTTTALPLLSVSLAELFKGSDNDYHTLTP